MQKPRSDATTLASAKESHHGLSDSHGQGCNNNETNLVLVGIQQVKALKASNEQVNALLLAWLVFDIQLLGILCRTSVSSVRWRHSCRISLWQDRLKFGRASVFQNNHGCTPLHLAME